RSSRHGLDCPGHPGGVCVPADGVPAKGGMKEGARWSRSSRTPPSIRPHWPGAHRCTPPRIGPTSLAPRHFRGLTESRRRTSIRILRWRFRLQSALDTATGRHEPLFPEDRDVIHEDFPKEPLLSLLRSIRRNRIHAQMPPTPAPESDAPLPGEWIAMRKLRGSGAEPANLYPLSTLAGSVNFFRTVANSAASLRIPSMSLSRQPRPFPSAES